MAQVGVGNGDQPPAILVVDDERELRELIAFLVEQAGFVALTAAEPVTALELFHRENPALALVDLNLQSFDGFQLVAELHRRSPSLPIIVLTGRNTEDDKVKALELGADDYVVKPFGNRELIARIRAHARRAEQDRDAVAPAILELGPLRLDPAERTVHLNGEVLRLTGTECRLLEYLMRYGDSVVSTAALAKRVAGYDDAPARDVVRVTVHRLRRKLRDNGPERRFIHTVAGVGFRLRPVEAELESEPST